MYRYNNNNDNKSVNNLPSSRQMFQAVDYFNDPVRLFRSIWSPLNKNKK